MKKILLMLALCTLIVFGCNKKDDALTDENVIVQEDMERSEEEGQKLTGEQACEIYFSQKDKWQYNGETSPMNGYGYCLLDLNFDGVCELIKNVNNGSGRFSYNEYFKINPQSLEVEKIASPEFEYGNGYDYRMFDEDLKLLMSSSDASAFYLCKNYTRITTGVYTLEYGKMNMSLDGIEIEESLFSEYHDERDEENPDNQTHLYNVKKDESFVEVNKQEYEAAMAEMYRQYYDSEVKWTCIDGEEFDGADSDTQKKLLSDAYNSFSCIWFFYD